jgi:hypothetical protein
MLLACLQCCMASQISGTASVPVGPGSACQAAVISCTSLSVVRRLPGSFVVLQVPAANTGIPPFKRAFFGSASRGPRKQQRFIAAKQAA